MQCNMYGVCVRCVLLYKYNSSREAALMNGGDWRYFDDADGLMIMMTTILAQLLL